MSNGCTILALYVCIENNTQKCTRFRNWGVKPVWKGIHFKLGTRRNLYYHWANYQMYEKLFIIIKKWCQTSKGYTSAHNPHKANTMPCVYIKIHWPISTLLKYIDQTLKQVQMHVQPRMKDNYSMIMIIQL